MLHEEASLWDGERSVRGDRGMTEEGEVLEEPERKSRAQNLSSLVVSCFCLSPAVVVEKTQFPPMLLECSALVSLAFYKTTRVPFHMTKIGFRAIIRRGVHQSVRII